MKLQIVKTFIDKETQAKYAAGDVVEFSKARAEELLSDTRGLVAKIKEEATEEKPKKAKKASE